MSNSSTHNVIPANTFIRSIFKFSISSWINFLISIISVMIVTRIFSPDIYGVLNIFNSASNLLGGVACLGLDSSFLRFYNEPPPGYDTKQLLAKCMMISISFLVGLSVICLPFFYTDISNALFNRVSLIITVLLCTNALAFIILNYFSTCYRMRNDARNYTIQSILLQFFSKCFVISAALIEPSTTIVILFNTIGVFVLTVIYFFIQKKDVLPNKIDWSFSGFSEVMKFALLSWPIVMVIHLNTFLSQAIINWKLGSYALGIYTSAGLFIGVLGVIQNGFRTYWASFVYANYKTEQEKIKKVHNFILLVVVLLMASFVISQNLLYSLLGEQYQNSRYFFTLVLVFPLLQIISETTSYGITIAKKAYYSLFIIILSTAINLFGSYNLIPIFGITGAAIASMFSGVIYITLSTIIGQRYYKTINQPLKTVLTIGSIVILAIMNCKFINSYFSQISITLVILLIVAICFRHEIKDIMLFLRKILRGVITNT